MTFAEPDGNTAAAIQTKRVTITDTLCPLLRFNSGRADKAIQGANMHNEGNGTLAQPRSIPTGFSPCRARSHIAVHELST